MLLAYRYDSFNLDAFSREANAFYMIFSRDPHLAAIGFVWNPLTSLLDIPLIILRPLWPALATRAFAAYIMSALFMAGSVKVMAECLADLAVSRFNRWLITAMYAVHPMIAYYGGNGMSEGIFLFTLMMTCRYLIRWLKEPDLKSLILSGTALALAYLARNEAVFPAALGVLTVGVFTYSRDRGRRVGRRVASAATDATIFSAPFAVCFFGWAVVSWVVVGHPFEQFSSVYGTASQLQAARKAGTLAAHGGIQTVARQLIALEPMLPAIVVLSCLVVVKRRNIGPLAPALVFGGVLCFAVLASLGGKTVGFFRYDIAEVPFSCLLAGVLVSAPLEGSRKCGRWAHVVAPILSIVLLAPAFPFTYRAMMDRTIGTEENENLAWIFGFGATGSTRRWRDVATVAREIDKLELSNGSILVDNFSPCFPELILNSNRPQQFVIPNDRDYERVLADPTTFHAAYFLVPPTVGSTGFGGLNAVNRAYPHLYDSGAGIADLVRDFNPSGCENWRLYRVKSVVPAANRSPSPAPRGS